MKGLANHRDDPRPPGECARCSQAEKTLRMAALQHAVTHADVDVRAAFVLATLEADAAGQESQLGAVALPDSGTPTKLRRGLYVGLADGSAGSRGAHGR